MKTILSLLLAPALLLAKEPAPKPDLTTIKHPVAPLLWKIEGNELKKPSYLFGSIHLSDKRVTTLHPAADKAFKSSDTIATEIDLGTENQIALSQLLVRADGKTLSQSIGKDLTKQLDDELGTINPALDSSVFQPLKTWAVTLTLASLEDALKQKQPLDLLLYNQAKEAGKSLWALETNEQQLGIFDKLTEDEHKKILQDTLSALKAARKEGVSIHHALLDAYLLGDTNKVLMTTKIELEKADNPELEKKFMKLLLAGRNDHITQSVVTKLKKEPTKSHFIVAGTLHYVGENNVVDLLKKQGYTVTLQAAK